MTEPQTPEGKELLALVERLREDKRRGLERIGELKADARRLRKERDEADTCWKDSQLEVERLREERDEALESEVRAVAYGQRLRGALEELRRRVPGQAPLIDKALHPERGENG